jgi:hypothetical protein
MISKANSNVPTMPNVVLSTPPLRPAHLPLPRAHLLLPPPVPLLAPPSPDPPLPPRVLKLPVWLPSLGKITVWGLWLQCSQLRSSSCCKGSAKSDIKNRVDILLSAPVSPPQILPVNARSNLCEVKVAGQQAGWVPSLSLSPCLITSAWSFLHGILRVIECMAEQTRAHHVRSSERASEQLRFA